jgi:hypothetical protein
MSSRLGGPVGCAGTGVMGVAFGVRGGALWRTAGGAGGTSGLLGRLLPGWVEIIPRLGEADLTLTEVERPLGAGEVEEPRLAARGGLILVAVGGGCADLGVVPEIVRFLLALTARVVWLVGVSSRVKCRPTRSAVAMRYDTPISLAFFSIKASSEAAHLSNSLAFQTFCQESAGGDPALLVREPGNGYEENMGAL